MLRKLICLCYFCLLALPCLPEPDKPKLVVFLLVDQFRYDYLDRFRDDFLPPRQADGRPGGFLYLENEAAFHSRCFYDHWPTHTAVGHAAISTGAMPSVHGVINNYWMDRKTGDTIDVGKDPSTVLVGAGSSQVGSSPVRLEAPTLGDALKLHTGGKSKVFGLAIKDRAAILASGKMADRAIWFDVQTGRWVTSSYYGRLPDYIQAVNEEDWATNLFDTVWDTLLPSERYSARRLREQDGVYGVWASIGDTFPHRINGGLAKPGPAFYEALTFTPQSLGKVVDLAQAIVVNEGLGRDQYTDLLTVGLSTNDKVGHAFGPYSPEVHDITVRTDREVARLLSMLDKEVGLENLLLVVTADHGVAALPEYSREVRLGGGRISQEALLGAIDETLTAEFGSGSYVRGFYDPHLYLNLAGLSSEQQKRAEELAKEAVESVEGVKSAILSRHIEEGRHRNTSWERKISASYFPERFGDLLVIKHPNWMVSFDTPKGTTHGTGWTHDSHVPLIVLGPGVPPGRYRKTCTPRDIVPTLAEILSLTPPSAADGELLEWLASPLTQTSSIER